MYRSRMEGGLDGATAGYVSSIEDDSQIALYDIAGSQAHVLMLLRQGIISEDDARKILSALESLKGGLGEVQGAEDVHEQIEAQVIGLAGMESGGRMHTARSRNDQVALDLRMRMRDDILATCGCLLDVVEALLSVAGAHVRTVMPLYTHLQQAQAGLFSHYLLAHADALLRDYERMSGMFGRVNKSPLGAGPVGGTSLPIDRDMTAGLLGFDGLAENSIDATGARDFVAEYVAACAILMTNLSRMAEDFVIWSTAEFSFVELADQFASPSSVMPQKKNPDILELTRGKAAGAIGSLVSVLAATKGLATGYGRDLQETKSPAWSASRDSIGALLVFKSMLLTVRVDEKAMRRAAESSNLVALDIADGLVREGVPFRVAHRAAGALAQLAHGSGRAISELGPGEIKEAAGPAGVDPDTLAGIIPSATVSSSLENRSSAGSAGYAEQGRMIRERAARVDGLRTEVTDRENRIRSAIEELDRQVAGLVGPGKGS